MNASRPTNLFIYSYHQCLFIILINTTLSCLRFFFFKIDFEIFILPTKLFALLSIYNEFETLLISKSRFFPPYLMETVECLRWNRVHVEVLSSIDSTLHVYFQKEFGLSSKEKRSNLIKTETFLSLPQVSWNIFLKFICLSLEALNSLSFKYSLPISQNLTNANIWSAFGISVFQFSIFSIYLFAGKLKSLRGI